MTIVVDASAIAAVVFGEPDGRTVAAHVDGERLIAPSLIDYELASVACKKLRRHPGLAPEIFAAVARLQSLPITRLPAPIGDVVALAAETGLTAYDAAYLWLALSQDAELVTLDDQLARINQARREPS